MIWMLVIADDMTGALDTGVQFSERGISTQIGTAQILEEACINEGVEVLVLNMETRHLSAADAYGEVRRAVQWAKMNGIGIIYKKTDSVLRGNIGSELTAVLEMSDSCSLYFFPAYPKMKRYTIDGTQYLEDKPLADTELVRDAFEPVSSSYIPDLIKQQSACSTVLLKRDKQIREKKNKKKINTIYICDAQTDSDMKDRLIELKARGELSLLAGCAGCAEVLAGMVQEINIKKTSVKHTNKLLISCGSLNQVTEKQLNYLQKKGMQRIHLAEKLGVSLHLLKEKEGRNLIDCIEQSIKSNGVIILDTLNADGSRNFMPEYRFDIARCHGIIAKELIRRKCVDTILMMGGDTLMGFMREIHCSTIIPICELKKGVVMSNVNYQGQLIQIISKSGGFGNEKLLFEIVEEMKM